ncbi:Ribosomal protein L13 [Spironucleus salmonicida]|uniref:Ribosomal protein L13 n=2 Tax=Spironucleus salmonicida TaxID=348837 RepID=V6LS08_9EUKA|nr:Ribosomal protein L13 [Spironucleus salmonicida]KAH0570344.1 Ribosomal protein L13 [Spironucleus salmonicida]|eukprot:EST47360.1 Ribosomal protein L13a [Spironucleus salmonicida]
MQFVVDCADHLLGRLASEVAQQLLAGQKVVLLCCENVNISGGEYRNLQNYLCKFNKHSNYNHLRGPFHFRTPAYIVHKTIRGMIPHKTDRGTAAMANLKVFEGIPPQYAKCERLTIPSALRELRLKPTRQFCVLGEVATKLGWKHAEDVAHFEDKRIATEAKMNADKASIAAKNNAVLAKNAKYVEVSKKLAEYGL